VVAGAADGFAAQAHVEGGDDQAGNGADEEWGAPAVGGAELASRDIAEGRADGDGEVEDGQNAVSLALRVEVGEDGGGEDAEGGLADADDGVADEEGAVVVDPGGGEGGDAPEECAGDDEGLAAEVVAEPAGEGGGDHVNEEEGGGEQAHLLVSGVEVGLDERDFAGEDVAVNVIEQVEGDEQGEGGRGGGDTGAGLRVGLGQAGSASGSLLDRVYTGVL